MEMCYDGTLIMPNSYAIMDVEEMEHLEGGQFVQKTQYKTALGVMI